ncbi:ABC transporter [Vibrio ishigakensis]|uniref:ABC transporter n=1 Tax=Vibrio ishigakensis TaxID=1481914 RepID=A0A0B8PSH1_9VIBR|nr:ABC transporter [Vibrio ishigakensis]
MIYTLSQSVLGLLQAIDADTNHQHFCKQWQQQNDIESLDDLLTLLERLAIPFQILGNNKAIPKQEHIAVLQIQKEQASIGRYSLNGYQEFEGQEFVEATAPKATMDSLFVVIKGYPEEKHSPDWLGNELNQYRPYIPKLLTISFVANLFALMIPFVTMSVYDHVIAGDAGHEVMGIGMGAILLFIMILSLKVLRSQLLSTISNRASREISEAIIRKVLATPLAQNRLTNSSNLMARLVNAESLKGLAQGPLGSALFDAPFVLLFIVAIGFLGGWIVVVPLIVLPLYFLLAVRSQKRIAQRLNRQTIAGTSRNSLLMEINTKLTFLRSTGYLAHWLKRFKKANYLASKNSFDHVTHQAKYTSIYYAVGLLSTLAVIALGIDLIFNQVMTAGGLIASMMLISRVTGPAQMLANSSGRFKQVKGAKQQVNFTLAQTAEGDFVYQHQPLTDKPPKIELDQVTLRYPSQQKPALSGISFSIDPGQLVVVTGPMASGKSSLLEVMSALIPTQNGSVKINGSNLSQYDPLLYRQWLGYMPARKVLPVLSIKEFIADGRAFSDNEVVASIVDAGGQEWLSSLSEGIDTQLMTLVNNDVVGVVTDILINAKLRLHESPMYLLDNPSVEMKEWILSKRGAATVVMTTHDKDMISAADQVVILDGGNLVYAGPVPEAEEDATQPQAAAEMSS